MQKSQRPIGITLLSVIAFIASLVLVSLSIRSAVLQNYRDLPKEKGEFFYALMLLISFWIALLFLATISFIAGLDLWKMKNRGRQLASISMILLFMLGGLAFSAHDRPSEVFGASFCAFAAISFIYLQLRNIREKFKRVAVESAMKENTA